MTCIHNKITISRKRVVVTLRDPGCIMRAEQRDLWLENYTTSHVFYPSNNCSMQKLPLGWISFGQTFLIGVSPLFFWAAISACVECRKWCLSDLDDFIDKWLNDTDAEIMSQTGNVKSLLPPVISHLKERHFSGLLHEQMELVDLLPHQRGYRVAAGNDALRLSEKIKTNYFAGRYE